MTLRSLYHDWRAFRRDLRLRRAIDRLTCLIDPADEAEILLAQGVDAWARRQEAPADRAMANRVRVREAQP